MPKLAIILRGISYYDLEEKVSNSIKVDYVECLESLRLNIIQPLESLFDTIDFYIVTYESEKLLELINNIKPKDSLIYSSLDIIKNLSIITTKLLQDSLTLVKSHSEYTHFLITRFDVYFYQKLKIDDIKMDKFNFGWVGEVGQCDDNFLLFNYKHIPRLNYYLDNYASRSCHYINKMFGPEECHYISKLDPDNGYHFPHFYIFYRNLSDYNKGLLKLF